MGVCPNLKLIEGWETNLGNIRMEMITEAETGLPRRMQGLKRVVSQDRTWGH